MASWPTWGMTLNNRVFCIDFGHGFVLFFAFSGQASAFNVALPFALRGCSTLRPGLQLNFCRRIQYASQSMPVQLRHPCLAFLRVIQRIAETCATHGAKALKSTSSLFEYMNLVCNRRYTSGFARKPPNADVRHRLHKTATPAFSAFTD